MERKSETQSRIEVAELGKLLDEHSTSLLLYASNWTSSGEDCVQEAFVKLAAQHVRPANPVAWLFKVVRNRALNYQRSEKRRRGHEQSVAKLDTEISSNPSLLIQANEEQELLRKQIDQLGSADRELVLLRVWSGLSWKEIAELTGLSSSSAHRKYNNALLLIKNKMMKSTKGQTHG